MSGPPPPYFPQPFSNPGTENNSRSATRQGTQPTAGNPPLPAVYPPQGEPMPSTLGACAMRAIEFLVLNDGPSGYQPQRPAPLTSVQSSALPPVHLNTRHHPPAPAPAPALTHSHSSSPPHGGDGAPSNPSGLVSPPSPSISERSTSFTHNLMIVCQYGAPGISNQRVAAEGSSLSYRACIF